MLLRRITQHVKNQNWFAVFLDFIIVVAGVFIGIQVANWNEARGDLERGNLLKTRLINEFLQIESDTTNNIRSLEQWQKDTRELSQLILAEELTATSENLKTQMDKINYWLQPEGTSATYTEIIAQGDTDLLSSSELQNALVDFNTIAERHLDANLVLYRSMENNTVFSERVLAIASIPVNERPEAFSRILQSNLSSPDIYLATFSFIRARDIDLNWHRVRLSSACRVLNALEQPCASVSIVTQEAVE